MQIGQKQGVAEGRSSPGRSRARSPSFATAAFSVRSSALAERDVKERKVAVGPGAGVTPP
ncbi:hypothetical protein ACWGN5_33710 [Streptomyces sp. NPDC055815]